MKCENCETQEKQKGILSKQKRLGMVKLVKRIMKVEINDSKRDTSGKMAMIS